ncbi:hypothetical protein AB0H43_02915 [Hamadaea sp. NPDC050747]|uniref:hypothetical protein n=1 Tax=Hamadaea sp. NPDC050747 TaxID=3155789 RepID=UPI0033FF707F
MNRRPSKSTGGAAVLLFLLALTAICAAGGLNVFAPCDTLAAVYRSYELPARCHPEVPAVVVPARR